MLTVVAPEVEHVVRPSHSVVSELMTDEGWVGGQWHCLHRGLHLRQPRTRGGRWRGHSCKMGRKKSTKGATSLRGAQVRGKTRKTREERVVCLPFGHPGMCTPYTPYNY